MRTWSILVDIQRKNKKGDGQLDRYFSPPQHKEMPVICSCKNRMVEEDQRKTVSLARVRTTAFMRTFEVMSYGHKIKPISDLALSRVPGRCLQGPTSKRGAGDSWQPLDRGQSSFLRTVASGRLTMSHGWFYAYARIASTN